jgi:hypothetical protein
MRKTGCPPSPLSSAVLLALFAVCLPVPGAGVQDCPRGLKGTPLIHHLRNAWSERLPQGGFGKDAAGMAAGHMRVRCKTDTRTGKQAEG